eukprot:GEMP01041098.1.p1 GENE.GEMP01041098.1~~GEMP01041098.1.p1  ORF type:complete len:138 (+),score=12.08 GEMP01041098.1:129-542(+)
MTIFVLKVKAKLEGVEKLIFPADHEWVLDVLQSGGTEERKGITISSTDEYELQGSRGTANYVMKWKDSKAQSSMSLYTPTRRGPLKGETLGEYTASQSEQFVAVAAFECRGLQPIGWTPSVAMWWRMRRAASIRTWI